MIQGTPGNKESRFRRLLEDLEASPSGPRLRLVAEVVLPLVVAGLLTWWVRATGFDLAAQQWIHRIGGGSWSVGTLPFWKALYQFGTYPMLALVFATLGAYIVSWRNAVFAKWRRVYVYLLLSAVLGPGVVTNLILKQYWGRPRPREIEEFDGHSRFEPVLTFDATSGGLSFPCGHATAGFFFLALYFLFRRHRPGLAGGIVFLSLSAGMLMGISRMVQGGHFFSDVVWAAVVCWFVPLGLYHGMRLDRGLVTASPRSKPVPLAGKAAFAVLGVAMLCGILVATPYGEKRNYTLKKEFTQEGPLVVHLKLLTGSAEILPAGEFRIQGEADGHGLPTSNIACYYDEIATEKGGYVIYAERLSGWFSELNAALTIGIPWSRLEALMLESGECDVLIRLTETEKPRVIRITEGSGRVLVDPAGQRVQWVPEGDPRLSGSAAVEGAPTGAGDYRIELGPGFRGRVEVAEGGRP